MMKAIYSLSIASILAQFDDLKGRHPGLWPIVPRLLCALGALLVVVCLGWYFYWDAQFTALTRAQEEEVSLKEAYQSKVQQAASLDALRKQKIQVEHFVSVLERQLPNKAEMAALLSDITQAGLGRGLQFDLFKPGQAVPKDYYAELPIEIKLNGSYHDIGTFASDIAHLPRIVTLNNMRISTNKDGSLALEAIAKTFRYLDPDEVASIKKAARGGKK